jgi:hypothetical protein
MAARKRGHMGRVGPGPRNRMRDAASDLPFSTDQWHGILALHPFYFPSSSQPIAVQA